MTVVREKTTHENTVYSLMPSQFDLLWKHFRIRLGCGVFFFSVNFNLAIDFKSQSIKHFLRDYNDPMRLIYI